MKQGVLLLIAAATGAAVMVLELMTVRLMAPWFGQSQVVWTNVIGIVLAALAAGQWLGGRWSERGHAAPVVGLLMLAGVLSLVLPDVVALLAPLTLPANLQLDEAWPFVTYGSLLVTIVAVGLPMGALGAVTPWLVRLSRESSTAPGRVSGAILGMGTMGSLVGTFGATHLLLPGIGSAWSVRAAGMLLLAVALTLCVLMRVRPERSWKAVAILSPALLLAAPHPARDARVLAAVETAYQDVRVELDPDGTRLLRINEGLDSFHSAYRPGDVWTDRYFDAFVGPALVCPPGVDGTRRVLVLGLGGGTMARQIVTLAPDVVVRGVELDRQLVDLGHAWFGLPQSVQVDSGFDARVALRYVSDPQSAIFIDAYSQQIYVPSHLCTEQFFAEVSEHLLPGGIAALNVGGLTREDPVVAAVSGTFARVFPGAVMARVPGTRNMMLIGVRGGTFDHAALDACLDSISSSSPAVREHLGWLIDPGWFAPVEPLERRPLRDGDAPVEALAHDAWRRSA